jgi:hypothetical protein
MGRSIASRVAGADLKLCDDVVKMTLGFCCYEPLPNKTVQLSPRGSSIAVCDQGKQLIIPPSLISGANSEGGNLGFASRATGTKHPEIGEDLRCRALDCEDDLNIFLFAEWQ